MTFIWPWMLAALAGVPLVVLAYRQLQLRRTNRVAQLAALGLAPTATTTRSATGRRRLVPPILFLLAVTVLLFSLARPQATIAEPRLEGTVVLTFDVSGSMAATDLSPTRMAAAKSAARAFVERQPSTVRIGVVAFGDSGLVTQRPTSAKSEVLAAIDRLTPQGGTSLGRGLQSSLGLITGRTVALAGSGEPTTSATGGSSGSGSGVEAEGQDLGYHPSAAVILLSDGEDTSRDDALAMAEVASTAGVRVYPIGLGSPEGTVLEIDGFQVSTKLDETSLKKIAETTDGQYYAAADGEALANVYDTIQPLWTVQPTFVEITAVLAAAALLLLLAGAGLSLAWFGRVI